MHEMLEGLEYRVFHTNPEPPTYRIGAKIRADEPLHGGNIHFVGELYDSRENAQTSLDTMRNENHARPRSAAKCK